MPPPPPTSALPADHVARIRRARLSLEGLSVGDALGERYFLHAKLAETLIRERSLPGRPWRYTDDTMMAASIVETLDHGGTIHQDDLARRFGQRFARDSDRGYGATACRVLMAIVGGADWRSASRAAFQGQGSMGNGGAMRAGPLGAYFADDLARVVEEARKSAQVTHAHPDGQAGAIAVAIAAAEACRLAQALPIRPGRRILEATVRHTPPGLTHSCLLRACDLPLDRTVDQAVHELGNGSEVVSYDTVPFALWCAARHLDNYEEAFWATVSGLGDRDTTCAIVGSIVALAVGLEGIPAPWRAAREPLPAPLA